MSGQIYVAIPAIMAEIGSIGKDRKNSQQGYQYRGIEDFYNVIQPLMVKYKIFSVPNVIDQKREERAARSGGILIYTVLTLEYTFFADDGSFIKTTVVGEGMDSGDKSSNKAMSVAHKYALAQIFMVPTKELIDPETDSPDPVLRKKDNPNEATLQQQLNASRQQVPKAPSEDDNPLVQRKNIEAEIGRLASLLDGEQAELAMGQTSAKEAARKQCEELREMYKAGDIEQNIAALKQYQKELEGRVAEKGVL